jgi:hypothetical protein
MRINWLRYFFTFYLFLAVLLYTFRAHFDFQVIPEFDRIVPHVPETANFSVKPLILQEDETVHVGLSHGSSTSSGVFT